jgi:hypothetical protein
MVPTPRRLAATAGPHPHPVYPGRHGPGTPCLIRLLLVATLAAALAARGTPASAAICHMDAVPAATLLLPYFEVNLDDPNGLTTLFSINNASAAAVLVHLTIWSDLGVAVLYFDVYLTGYDVQTVNLRDVLFYGKLPQTASLGQDPFDTISPKGQLSEDIDFPSCNGILPLPDLPASYLTHVQRSLTGRPSPLFNNVCFGRNLGDNVARGYVTLDTVRNCTLRYAGQDGYFASATGAGDITDQNVLWGNWYIVNTGQGYAQGSNMVSIEADGRNPATSTPGKYTFYGRYVGWSAADHREPLATSFAAQYALGGGFDAGTDLLVWRDPKVDQDPFPCPATPGSQPAWYPLAAEKMVAFDEQEHPGVNTYFPCDPSLCPPSPPIDSFAAVTQRVGVNSAALPVPFNFGWLYLDLNNGNAQFAGNNPAADPLAAQGWVVVAESSHARFAVALDAHRLDSACSPSHFVPHQ